MEFYICFGVQYCIQFSSVSSVAQSCLTICDPMDCSTPGFPVYQQLLETAQTHVHRVGDDIQQSHPLSSPSPPAFNLPQHQGLFQWVSSSHHMAKVLEFQLQHQSFQWIFRTDFLSDLLAVQGTLKSLLQNHSSKASILQRSVFFIVQLSHSCMTTGKTIALTRWTFRRWQSKRMYTHLLLRELQNYNLLLNNHRQENDGSHQKRIPHVQGQRRSPNKMVGGAKSCLESNPIPTRDTWRAQTKPCVHQRPHRDPTETEANLPLHVWVSPVEAQVSSALPQGQGLWLQQTWNTWQVA